MGAMQGELDRVVKVDLMDKIDKRHQFVLLNARQLIVRQCHCLFQHREHIFTHWILALILVTVTRTQTEMNRQN